MILHFIRKYIVIVIMFLFFSTAMLISLWGVIFYSYLTALMAFTGGLIFLPLKTGNKRIWKIRFIIFIVGIVLIIPCGMISIYEVNNRIKILSDKPRQMSLSSFTTRDKSGIFGINLVMGFFAYPIYPEVSKETICMIFPPPENGVRVFKSDFAVNSKKIRKVIKEFNRSLKKSEEKRVKLKKRIYWNVSEYRLGKKEARYALALNPADMVFTAVKKESFWKIDVSLKVKCIYPQNSNVTLISTPKLQIEEGLFWVLQQSGWLFPYTAEWKFTINSDDKRIKDHL